MEKRDDGKDEDEFGKEEKGEKEDESKERFSEDSEELKEADIRGREKYKLKHKWNLWEQWENIGAKMKSEDYLENMQVVGTFDNLVDFWRVWNHIPHALPSNYFYNVENKTQTHVKIKGEFIRINSFALFRHPIKPLYEEEANARGGYFSCAPEIRSRDELNKLWQKLVFYVIGNNFDFSDNINGVRILDKSSGHGYKYKFEVWVDFREENKTSQLEGFFTGKSKVDFWHHHS